MENFDKKSLKQRSQYSILRKCFAERDLSGSGINGGFEHDSVMVQIESEQGIEAEEESSGTEEKRRYKIFFHNFTPLSLAALRTTLSELAAIAPAQNAGESIGVPKKAWNNPDAIGMASRL